MFDRISPRYDRVNRLMTLNADQRWRRALVERLQIGPGDRVLDLASGTGDFSRLCLLFGADVVSLDFSRGMLEVAAARPGLAGVLVQATPSAAGPRCLLRLHRLGFALRNFTALEPVVDELARVVRPGGRLGLLEVDRPGNPVIAAGHALYFNRLVPLVGGLLSDQRAYRYLPESVAYLPPDRDLARLLHGAGFTHLRKRRHMLGAAQSITALRR
jgi:demethylmenaquinone methyltransferase/2-methoxy-6-polyprenyl-1,4-benzoquinol methylase